MTDKEMAAFLKCSVRTVHNMAAEGAIGKFQPLGKNTTARFYLKGEK